MTSTLSCVTVSGVESVYVDSIRSGPARVRQEAIWSSDRSRKVAGRSLSDCRFAPDEQTSRKQKCSSATAVFHGSLGEPPPWGGYKLREHSGHRSGAVGSWRRRKRISSNPFGALTMAPLSFWGCVVKPGKTPTTLKRAQEFASVIIKQVRLPPPPPLWPRPCDGAQRVARAHLNRKLLSWRRP
jgi:hypothetical protein